MKAIFNAARERIDSYKTIKLSSLKGAFNFHSPIEILFVAKGECKVWINDTETILKDNEIALVPSYQTHRYLSTIDNGEYIVLFISTIMCPLFVEEVNRKNIRFPIVRDCETVEKIKYGIYKLLSKELNPIEQIGYINVILGAFLHNAVFDNTERNQAYNLLSKLFLYINEHYKEELNADKIAKTLGYSKDYLLKYFRKQFQMGINEYVNTLRLNNALKLMQESNRSVTACALESGFCSMRTFYRSFNDEFGCSPREYLKKEGLHPQQK